MESPRRESGQVKSCSQPYATLSFGVLVEKLRSSRYGMASKDIDHSVRLSTVLHVGELTPATRPTFFHCSTLFS